jgi:hypothetical protein
MTLSKNSSLSSEVFQSAQHFRRKFSSGVSSFSTILAQTFFMSKYSLKIVWTDDFPKPSSSAIIVTVNRRSLSTRGRTRSMFYYPLRWRGVLTWHRPSGLHGLPEKPGPTWKQLFPIVYTLHKPVATFDWFLGIFAKFHKKRDVNSLFKLLMNRHFGNARIRVPHKSKARSLSYSGLARTESQLCSVEWVDLEGCSTS